MLGHEYSVFYEDRDDVSQLPSRSYSDTWLQADPSKVLQSYGIKFDGKTRAYRIVFIGTKSDAPGLYGHFGAYSQGALVLRMLKLEQVPFSRPESTNS